MRLRARVRETTGATRHLVAGDDKTLEIASVEIESGDDAFYLLYFDAGGQGITDTWHLSIEAAKAQAHFEFRISESDWESVE